MQGTKIRLLAGGLLMMATAGYVQADALQPDPAWQQGTLSNGLQWQVLTTPQRPSDRVEIRLLVNTGSLAESTQQSGYSHAIPRIALTQSGGLDAAQARSLWQQGIDPKRPMPPVIVSYDTTLFNLSLPNNRNDLLKEALSYLANEVIFGIINMIMRLAPIGAFGAMAFTIGKYGVGTLVQLGQLIICFYITCILFVVLVLGSIAKATGFSIFKFIRYIREELLIVLGTSSSESALPRMLDKMEKLGCRKSVVGLVIPTGYSFNLDGTSIYLTMAAVFIAQATNSQMDIVHQITLLIVLLLSSKGAAGVTGSGFIVLAATLSAVGHLPVAGLALILGIDRFMSEARALTNLVGNGVATIVVAKWVKELDHKKLDDVLNNRAPDGKTHELSS